MCVCSYSKTRSKPLDIFQGDINSHNPQDELVLRLLRETRRMGNKKKESVYEPLTRPVPLSFRNPSKEIWTVSFPKASARPRWVTDKAFPGSFSVTVEVTLSASRWTCKLILKHLATGSFLTRISRFWSLFDSGFRTPQTIRRWGLLTRRGINRGCTERATRKKRTVYVECLFYGPVNNTAFSRTAELNLNRGYQSHSEFRQWELIWE